MLQKVAVRMLHDQRFLEKVYAAPMETLSDIGLSSAQIHLLVDADIRRWRADPLRPARLLHALIEEFPVTVASTRSDTG